MMIVLLVAAMCLSGLGEIAPLLARHYGSTRHLSHTGGECCPGPRPVALAIFQNYRPLPRSSSGNACASSRRARLQTIAHLPICLRSNMAAWSSASVRLR